MAIEYTQLRPKSSKIILFDKEYILKPFSLAAQVWANHEFATTDRQNGLFNLAERMKNLNDLEAILKLTYYLMEDKTSWPTYKDFYNLFDKKKIEKPYLKIMEIYTALVECLGNSQPQNVEELEAEAELKKVNGAIH